MTTVGTAALIFVAVASFTGALELQPERPRRHRASKKQVRLAQEAIAKNAAQAEIERQKLLQQQQDEQKRQAEIQQREQNELRIKEVGERRFFEETREEQRIKQQAALDKLPQSEKLVVTTGYWRLTNENADQGSLRNGPGGYLKRMHMVMNLNTPIVTYGDEFGVTNMGIARGNTTPPLVDGNTVPLDSLPPCATHGTNLRANSMKYTHQLHMPSITLGCIWDGKFSLIARTAREHPGYGWYAWLDIGMHGGPAIEKTFTDWGAKPWPNQERLMQLPRDKISASRTFACHTCQKGVYLPFCHCAAATAMIIPAQIVHEVVDLFYSTLEKCLKDTEGTDERYPCMSEQVIMTQMELARPGLYNFVGKGYGAIAGNMTADFAYSAGTTSGIFDWLGGSDGEPSVMLDKATAILNKDLGVGGIV